MLLSPGTRVGPYEILAPIGAGGMGEVYRARDTRLDRLVAIKVSHEQFSARFEQEARAVAALNHSNICTLHDVGPNYLVMEYLEGDTLAARITQIRTKGPLPLDYALSLGIQIADALDAAHRKGVVHRDLKPANVMLTKSGTKLLDFGLARMRRAGTSAAEDVTRAITTPGTILGTFQYMAPEQLEAKDADARSDIFAFGAVLYEILTGRKAFEGKSQASLISAIMSSEPAALATLQPLTPAPLDRVVRKCLAKDPDKRWQSAGDLADELRWVAEGASRAQTPVRLPHHRILPWVAAAALLLMTLALGVVAYRDSQQPPRLLKFFVLLPEKSTLAEGCHPAVSPDGRSLAVAINMAGQRVLWVRALDSLSGRTLPETEGADYPFWSQDSRFLAFFAGGKLKRMDVAGGPALALCDARNGYGGSWSKKDVIVFAPAPSSGLFRVPAAGGTPVAVTALDRGSGTIAHRAPWFLPDGHHFLYTARNLDSEKTKVHIADLDSTTQREVLVVNSNAVYAPPGYLLFRRGRTLMAQTFDSSSARTTGDPVALAEQVDGVSLNSLGLFSASPNAVLAYVSGAEAEVKLTWYDRRGNVTGTVGALGLLSFPTISPDGATVAVNRQDAQTGFSDIWLHDLARGTATRFTFGPRDNRFPVWSPDGRQIAFASNRDGGSDIYQKSIGGAQEERLDKDAGVPEDWSRDGRFLIEGRSSDPKTGFDIWALPLFGDRRPLPYLRTAFSEGFAKLSPDGRRLAYVSNESKRFEIYVQTFPALGGKRQISTNGGSLPTWSRDGKE
ncbi:MAG: protein kinase, partial [Acidobacteriota bacterium]|nr:protein kinase [Acidobacteriota bacterium]